MDLREDQEFVSVLDPKSPSIIRGKGLMTLGLCRTIKIESNDFELLPIIIYYHYGRGTRPEDVRVRRNPLGAIPLLAESYAQHYNSSDIGENWTKEDAIDMMKWHYEKSEGDLFITKWAREQGTTKEFPIGFASAYQKPYGRGKTLWDVELFVLPEFHKCGVGTELMQALLIKGKAMGSTTFEALTYQDEKGHPLKWWVKYGVNATDLVHIVGDIDNMFSKMETETVEKRPTIK